MKKFFVLLVTIALAVTGCGGLDFPDDELFGPGDFPGSKHPDAF